MRDIHDTSARFRISQKLRAEAEAKAAREGMTFSELVRHALRREVRKVA